MFARARWPRNVFYPTHRRVRNAPRTVEARGGRGAARDRARPSSCVARARGVDARGRAYSMMTRGVVAYEIMLAHAARRAVARDRRRRALTVARARSAPRATSDGTASRRSARRASARRR